MYSFKNVDALLLDVWRPALILKLSPQAHLIISHFSGRESCICQTWKGSPRGEFWSSEDGQNIIIHPIYLFNNVDALSLDVWGPAHVLKPSPQAHLIISHFSGRGSCICQTWKGLPRGEFWSSEDGQKVIFIQCIHLIKMMCSHWISEGRITSYSRQLKCIWKKRVFAEKTI